MAALNGNTSRKAERGTGITDDDMEFATFIADIIGSVNPVHKMFLKVMMLIYVNTIHTTRDLRRNNEGENSSSSDSSDSSSSSHSTRPVVKTETGTQERRGMKRSHARRFSANGQYAICGNPNILMMSDILTHHQNVATASTSNEDSPALNKYKKMLGKDLRKFIVPEEIPSETEDSSSDSEFETVEAN